MNIILGQDFSKYQEDIDWDIYKNNSNFVIIKASEGYGYVDTSFHFNQLEARRVGLPLGYYHFARPDLKNTPEMEVGWFLEVCGALREGEFFCLDYEANWDGDVVGWCKKFLDFLQAKTGVKAFVYLNQDLIKKYDWKPVVDGNYPLWVAAYTYDPKKNTFVTGVWPSAAMQQWTNKQEVPGIEGLVDGDVFFGTEAALEQYGFKIVSDPVVPPSDLDLHKKVDELNEKIVSIATGVKTFEDKFTSLSLQVDNVKKDTEELYKDRETITAIKENTTAIEGKVESSMAKQTTIETSLKQSIRTLGENTETEIQSLAKRVKILEEKPIPINGVTVKFKLGSFIIGKLIKTGSERK